MATSQQQLVCDNSTLSNFVQWASAISGFVGSCGFFTKAIDSGQVDWGTISAVPGSGAYLYEIWQSNDGLATFYLKLEYGNINGTNCPSLRLSLATSTNGAGVLGGYVTPVANTNINSYAAPSSTTQYECNFSGAPGRLGVMMWRTGTNNCQQFLAVERSVDASGNYTSEYVTFWSAGVASFNGGTNQISLVFGKGVPPYFVNPSNNASGGWNVRVASYNGGTTAFAGSIPFDTPAPQVGYWGRPCTVVGVVSSTDLTDGLTFQLTLYGQTRTYLPSKNGYFGHVAQNSQNLAFLCMRFD